MIEHGAGGCAGIDRVLWSIELVVVKCATKRARKSRSQPSIGSSSWARNWENHLEQSLWCAMQADCVGLQLIKKNGSSDGTRSHL